MKFLGVELEENLNHYPHIEHVSHKVSVGPLPLEHLNQLWLGRYFYRFTTELYFLIGPTPDRVGEVKAGGDCPCSAC